MWQKRYIVQHSMKNTNTYSIFYARASNVEINGYSINADSKKQSLPTNRQQQHIQSNEKKSQFDHGWNNCAWKMTTTLIKITFSWNKSSKWVLVLLIVQIFDYSISRNLRPSSNFSLTINELASLHVDIFHLSVLTQFDLS